MKALEILERRFLPVGVPTANQLDSGVYLLIEERAVVYVGSSRNVLLRVGQHYARLNFDAAIWHPLPWKKALRYEGALCRYFDPEHSSRTPTYRGHDERITSGLGLSPLQNLKARIEKWRLKRGDSLRGRKMSEEDKAFHRKRRAMQAARLNGGSVQ